MDVLFALLCCVLLALGMGLGVGISFYAEKFFGRRAYVAGLLVPIVFFVTLYALYHLWLRLLSCTPVDRVCGEPFVNLALVFVLVLCVFTLANASAQFSLYLFRHRRNAPPPQSAVQETAETSETTESAEPTMQEPAANDASSPEDSSPTE